MIFLNSEQGKKLSRLQNIIFTNLPLSGEFITDEVRKNNSREEKDKKMLVFYY